MRWNDLGMLILGLGPTLAGCAGLPLRQADVGFEDPAQRLGIQEVQPDEAEKAGVLLRLNPAPAGQRKTHEENVLFAQVKKKRGLEVRLIQDQTETFKPGSRPDTYLDLSQTTFEGQPGRLIDEAEVSTRGEIVRFIRGVHESKMGKFRIVDWKRSPTLPAGPVKMGDTWQYEETMDVRVDSWLVKEKDPQPYRIKAACVLSGFAAIAGRRVAVIKVEASQNKRERLKVLFKELTMDVQTDIEELDYLDYAQGVIVAKITRSHSRSIVADYGIQDEEQGQSVSHLQ